ncbi:Ubiquinone biosynthesis O-methyltransferase [Acaryochloris thomasi RCC1774]|uniref:Ubiquinone biosynthesis O-methyltransferase n=1 Tax=Acaryochloris thomasi RCC1774 TaxID=1764569 RepID=A0A2W1JJ74_9CYAN|nr:class I SAM-dependent methyltransferase [Acaryochloris thomasi]PZD73296.1 Ubiquinone biosynthesis O-methyltransferase [Acaryochloris thomasi RCC1774]
MFTSHTSKFWNDRYGDSNYIYGTAPNQFLTHQQHRLKSGMNALAVGDGEGRNGVWLAQQGLRVLSVDLSAAGLKKAKALATQHNVQLQTDCVDLATWAWPQDQYDLVISIYLHLSPELRPQIHWAMLSALKPGGLLILEAFNPQQIEYQHQYDSGGPKIPEMLYTPELLRQDFANAEVLELTETITDLSEGEGHHGQASVVRLVLQKKAA